MSKLGPGCFGGFEFGDDRSEKTTRSGKTATTYQFDEQSKFSIETDATMDWGTAGEADEEGDAVMGGVEVEMPPGGINNRRKRGCGFIWSSPTNASR